MVDQAIAALYKWRPTNHSQQLQGGGQGCSVCLVIFRLLKDFFIHFIPVYRRVAMLGQQQYQIDLQLGLDVLALAPVGVSHLVVHHGFYLGGQGEQLVFGVAEIVFDGQLFENVVEP